MQISPRHGRDAFEGAQGTSMGVGLDFFEAYLAQDNFLITRLEAEFADVLGAVVDIFVDSRHFLFVDARHVTDGMHPESALGIVALQTRTQFRAVQAMPLDRKARGFLVAEMGAQHQTFEARALAQLLAKQLDVFFVERHQPAELAQQRIHVLDLVGYDFDGHDRIVLRQHDTVAIQDQAAHRRYRHRIDTVGL